MEREGLILKTGSLQERLVVTMVEVVVIYGAADAVGEDDPASRYPRVARFSLFWRYGFWARSLPRAYTVGTRCNSKRSPISTHA